MLSDQAARLLSYIVKRISQNRIRGHDPRTFLTYKSIHDDLGLELNGPTYGLSLLSHGLTELATLLRDINEPAISSLIVNQPSDLDRPSLPGDDFFRFHGRDVEDYNWWLSQARASLTNDWERVVQAYTILQNKYIIYPEEITQPDGLLEGTVKSIVVNRFERNDQARTRCLQYYGYHCAVCEMNFEERYGEIGRGYIHVHHLVPLSTIRGEYVLDPIQHLRPVCPNCHAMLHQKRDEPYTIEELRERLRQ